MTPYKALLWASQGVGLTFWSVTKGTIRPETDVGERRPHWQKRKSHWCLFSTKVPGGWHRKRFFLVKHQCFCNRNTPNGSQFSASPGWKGVWQRKKCWGMCGGGGHHTLPMSPFHSEASSSSREHMWSVTESEQQKVMGSWIQLYMHWLGKKIKYYTKLL